MSATSAAAANGMDRNNVSSASASASASTQQVEDAQRQLVAMHHRLAATKRSLSEVVDEYRFVEEQLDQARKRVRFLCDLYAEANSVHFRTIKQFRAYNLELEQCVRRLGAREALQDLTPLAVRAAEALKAALDHQTRAEDELPRVGLPDLSAALSQDDSADGDGAGLALHRHHAHRASVSVQTGPDSAKQELARRIAELQAKLSIERAQRERAEADLNTMQRDAASALDTMVELQVENEKLRQQAETANTQPPPLVMKGSRRAPPTAVDESALARATAALEAEQEARKETETAAGEIAMQHATAMRRVQELEREVSAARAQASAAANHACCRCETEIALKQKKASKAENEKQALAVRAAKALREVEGQVQVLTAAVVAARRAGHSIPQLNL